MSNLKLCKLLQSLSILGQVSEKITFSVVFFLSCISASVATSGSGHKII